MYYNNIIRYIIKYRKIHTPCRDDDRTTAGSVDDFSSPHDDDGWCRRQPTGKHYYPVARTSDLYTQTHTHKRKYIYIIQYGEPGFIKR